MNLLLLEREELAGDGTCVLADRRAEHVRGVLGAGVGTSVRVGVVGGELGAGEVIADDGVRLTLRIVLSGVASVAMAAELVLAIPRPKVLSRAVEIAAAFGIARIDLTNAWRVDKSYLRSPRLEPSALGAAARLGAEQGATTHVAPVVVHERLMGLLHGRFGAPGAGTRLIAHPGGVPIEQARFEAGTTVLAVGPEGGWIEREVETFVARGFQTVSLGAPILRVEAAIAAALGQLVLLERLRAR